jgi:hypothetical protein
MASVGRSGSVHFDELEKSARSLLKHSYQVDNLVMSSGQNVPASVMESLSAIVSIQEEVDVEISENLTKLRRSHEWPSPASITKQGRFA